MGKAKRAKLKKELEEQRRIEAEAKHRAEKKETMKIYTAVIAVVLVVALIVGSVSVLVTSIKKTGNYLRNTVSVSSENYEINNAMLSYLFADNFYMQKSYFDYYQSYFGFDTSKSLKSQSYGDDMTWYDYFLESALDNAASMLISCEGARAEGIDIDEKDMILVEKEITALKDVAEGLDMSMDDYLSEYYGLGVKESDVRDALKLYYLSTKYYYHQLDSIEVTDADINAYYDANEMDFLRVSYRVYTVSAIVESDFTDAEKQKAYNDAEAAANALAAAKTEEEFDELLQDYLTDLHKRDGSTGVSLEDIVEEIDDTKYESASYSEDSEYSEWLFADDTNVGDTKVIETDDGEYAVYMLTAAKAREEYATKSVRHILFLESEYESKEACLAAAEAILAEFKATDMTVAEFGDLALKHSADTGSVYLGGLYENITKGQMVEEFEDWCFDETREEGDVEIVYTESYGYHIMYFAGDGDAAWAAAVRDAIIDEEYEEMSTLLIDAYKAEVDSSAAKKIPDIN